MARTFTLPKKGSGNWSEGWHTLTISKAEYGDWEDTKYIDLWFEGYPENFNMRIYAKIGKDGEEFAIGSLKIDDSAEALAGKTVNVMFYKDGKFTRPLTKVAPIPFKNIVEEFTERDVVYFKGKAESFFSKWVEPKLKDEVSEPVTTVTDDIPF